MLFAAGFGTRMGDLTKDRPKPLVEVAGRPLIEHALAQVRGFGARTIVANAHYKADQIVQHFAGTDVHVHVESPDILDTGGGLKAALHLLDAETVFTMNTDAVWLGSNPLNMLHNAWMDDMKALLLCIPKPQAVGHVGAGDIDISDAGKARWGSETVYSGLQIIRTDLVSETAQNVFSLKSIWEDLVNQGHLNAVSYDGLWCDVGHPDGVTLAEAMVRDAHV